MSGEEEKVAQVSAGEQLRHLREQKNLSAQDVANRLNLDTRIIESIESDNFDSLPAATYVRGYLRSYAKILNADADAILAAYNNDAPDAPEIIPEVKHSSQTSSSDKPVKAVTYLISLSLFILLVAWWYNQQLNKPVDSSTDTVVEEEVLPPPGLPYDIPVIVHSPSPYYSAVPAEAEDIAESSMAEESVETSNAGETTAEENEADDYPLSVSSESEGPDSLVLTLSADSWIEVHDAFGEKVFLNIGREGQVLSLRGTAPFNVLLGFSEGVAVEFNGEKFDASPYTKGSIARFNLDN